MIRSVSTMSSAPRLLASVAGLKSRAISLSKAFEAATLVFSASRNAASFRSGFMFGCITDLRLRGALRAAEQWVLRRDGSLVRLGKMVDAGDGGFKLSVGIATLGRLHRVKTTTRQIVELVAQDFADCAKFARVAVTAAEQRGDRIAAPVSEFGEIHADHRKTVEVVGDLGRILIAGQPYAGIVVEFVATRLPYGERYERRTARERDRFGFVFFAQRQDDAGVVLNAGIANELRHGRLSFASESRHRHGP